MGLQNSIPISSTVNHKIFGAVSVDNSANNKFKCKTLQAIIEADNKIVYDRWASQIQKLINQSEYKKKQKKQPIDNYILVPISHFFEQIGYCGSNGLIHIQYEAFMYDLQTEIQTRKINKKYFLQTEIWYVLYTLVNAVIQSQKTELDLEENFIDIHPSNILLNQQSQLKLITKLTYPNQIKSFQTPEESVFNSNINKSILKSKLDKIQVFCIGLTILSVASLQNIEKTIYRPSNINANKSQINKNQLFKLLKNVGQHYSSFLYSIILSMLSEKIQNRKSSKQIYQSLIQYQESILQLQPFLPDNSRYPSYR